LLKGGFTVVEKTLIENGRQQTVHDIRHTFQLAMEERFTNVVQDALGRDVIAYMSQVHSGPDISAELFVLEPKEEEPVLAEHETTIASTPSEQQIVVRFCRYGCPFPLRAKA
jgi:uncharacterized protein YbcI